MPSPLQVSYAEILGSANHSRPYPPSKGFWYYYAPGSGVFTNVGFTLRAPNKLAALHRHAPRVHHALSDKNMG